MRVFVTGGEGLVGAGVARALSDAGHDPVALLPTGEADVFDASVGVARGDAADVEALAVGMDGCHAVVHAAAAAPGAGDPVEATVPVVEAALATGARRFLHVSALGAAPRGPPRLAAHWRGEEAVRESGLVYTVFRPGLVVGPGGAVERARRLLRVSPVAVVAGPAEAEVQPVALQDVAAAVVRALGNPKAVNATYPLCGPERMTREEFVKRVLHHFGLSRPVVHGPAVLARASRFARRVPGAAGAVDDLAPLLEGHEPATPNAAAEPPQSGGGGVRGDHAFGHDLGVRLTGFDEAMRVAYGPSAEPRRFAAPRAGSR